MSKFTNLWHNQHQTIILLFVLAAIVVFHCGKKQDKTTEGKTPGGTVVVVVPGDIDSFNPIVAAEQTAADVNDAIFPLLTGSKFNTQTGVLEYLPILAKSWEFANDHKDLIYHLRGDAYWQDGVKITGQDVKFSYELYADPDVASVQQDLLEEFLHTKDGKVDIERSVEVPNDTTVIFHFQRAYPLQMFHSGLTLVPRHIFQNADRKSLRTNPNNSQPIAAGPFKLERWTRQQEIVLARNEKSVLPHPAYVDRLVIRVVPEYASRLTQLKTGEADFMEGVNPEDVKDLKQSYAEIRLETIPGRFYDYVGWSNIDNEVYVKSNGKVIKPHPLFGSKKVRQALTLAINRQEILDGFLGEYGQLATGPISPVFKWAYNDTLKPYPFDPGKAKQLLKEEGWEDHNGDGILDKGGRKFAFKLRTNSGNPRRAYASVIIQNNLKVIGIEVEIEQLESNVFFDGLRRKKYEAFLAGLSVPLEMDFENFFGSDLQKDLFNTASFQNKRVDEIFSAAKKVIEVTDAAPLWKEFQVILYEEQPVTFLYWVNRIVGINNRVQGTSVNILGALTNLGDWYVTGKKAGRLTVTPSGRQISIGI